LSQVKTKPSLVISLPNPMKISLFTETFLPKVDGIVTRLKHTVEHLSRQGHQVQVFCPDGGLTEYQGAQIEGISAFPFPLYPELKAALPRPAIGQKLKDFNPDIIHVVNPAILGLSGVYYAKRHSIPLLASYHTHLPEYLKHYGLGALESTLWCLMRLVHNRAKLNLCTSSVMVEALKAQGIERLDLWQRGVDTESFEPSLKSVEMRDRLTNGHPESPLLLYVGRLSAEKEIDRIKPVLEAIPNARLAIVGGGPQRQALEAHFAGTATHFVGYLQGKELGAAYASADAFIFPSRTETLGLVLLEAMAAGCPVIAANSGGIPDIVTNGVNGFLFDPLDDNAAVQAALGLFGDRDLRETLPLQARQEAERWGWSAATRQLVGYYEQVIKVDLHLKGS
jgi:glycosyltransferase involved in cell wall biosynthesis